MLTLKDVQDRVNAFVKYFGEDKEVSVTSTWCLLISDKEFPHGVIPFFFDDEGRNEEHEEIIRRITNGK